MGFSQPYTVYCCHEGFSASLYMPSGGVVMFEVAWCVTLYTTVLFLEFIPVVFERFGWHTPLHWIHKISVPLMIVGVLLSTFPLFKLVDKNFLNNDDQSEFEINLRAPEGTSLESTEIITNRVATAIRSRVPEVSYTPFWKRM